LSNVFGASVGGGFGKFGGEDMKEMRELGERRMIR
jgi:hypothetical protein